MAGKKPHFRRRSTKATATKAIKAVKKLSYKLRPELKMSDTSVLNTTYSSSGTVTPLNLIAQGSGQGQRIGMQITAKGLLLSVLGLGNTQNNCQSLRIMIVADNENTGTTPTASDILDTTGSRSVIVSPVNDLHRARYKVLLDKVVTFSHLNNWTAATSGHDDTEVKHFKKYIRLNRKLMYQGTGAAAADLYKGAIYLCGFSDTAANDAIVTWYSRLLYTDA